MAGKFELKKSKNDKYFFTLQADTGQIILTSEMYEAKASAVIGMESVKKNTAEDARYSRLTGKDGSLYFTLKASNGQVVGQSQCTLVRKSATAMSSCASPRGWAPQ